MGDGSGDGIPRSTAFNSVWGASGNDVFAVGSSRGNGVIWRYGVLAADVSNVPTMNEWGMIIVREIERRKIYLGDIDKTNLREFAFKESVFPTPVGRLREFSRHAGAKTGRLARAVREPPLHMLRNNPISAPSPRIRYNQYLTTQQLTIND